VILSSPRSIDTIIQSNEIGKESTDIMLSSDISMIQVCNQEVVK